MSRYPLIDLLNQAGLPTGGLKTFLQGVALVAAQGPQGPPGPVTIGFTADQLGSLSLPTGVPLGYAHLTSATVSGFLCSRATTITKMRAKHTGNVSNAGKFVSYNLYKNNVIVGGNASVVADAAAAVNANATGDFTVNCIPGDLLTIVASISEGPLVDPVTDIAIGLS